MTKIKRSPPRDELARVRLANKSLEAELDRARLDLFKATTERLKARTAFRSIEMLAQLDGHDAIREIAREALGDD